jgi:hypothetical protein
MVAVNLLSCLFAFLITFKICFCVSHFLQSSLMDKMKMVDPMDALAPMRTIKDEGPAKDDREKSVSEAVQEEVENRMTKAAEELKQKYARGEGGRDASENGPTGAAYTAAAVAERERRKAIRDAERAEAEAKAQKDAQREADVRYQFAAEQGGSDEEEEQPQEEDSDDELLNELDGDPEVKCIIFVIFFVKPR